MLPGLPVELTFVTDFEPGVRRIVREVCDELSAEAPPTAVTVILHVTVGEPEPGYWCDMCLLPSAAEFPLHGLHERGVIELGRMRACPDCGQIERVS